MSTALDVLLLAARRRLSAAGITSATLDARILAREAFGLDDLALLTASGRAVDAADARTFEAMIRRRAAGEPVGRILGRREFHGLDMTLGADTLEPRPDTETLVDHAIDLVRRGEVPGAAPDGSGLRFADIGTGSGAIALALLVALPGARAVATDIAEGALAVAATNAERFGVSSRLELLCGSWLEPLSGRVGLILSNPPYIPSREIAALATEVRDHDPLRALDGGADGLVAYRALCGAAAHHLVPGGRFAVEIGLGQEADVAALMEAAGLSQISMIADLSGRVRVVSCSLAAGSGSPC